MIHFLVLLPCDFDVEFNVCRTVKILTNAAVEKLDAVAFVYVRMCLSLPYSPIFTLLDYLNGE